MLIRLFARVIFGAATVVGFILFIIFSFPQSSRSESFFDGIPSWLKIFLLFCVICYGIAEIIFMVKGTQYKPREQKHPNI